MTIGDKIKKIRTFRNMTQAELGAALGWGDKGANRLAQYETNYRVEDDTAGTTGYYYYPDFTPRSDTLSINSSSSA